MGFVSKITGSKSNLPILDRLYYFVIICLLSLSCSNENKTPVSRFSVEPYSGNLGTTFYFDASETIDPDNSVYSLFFRWDFNADGTWETFFSRNPKAAYKFSQSGNHLIVLEVKDPFGNLSQVTKTIAVSDKNDPPEAELRILPPRASIGTIVFLDGSGTTDDMDDTGDLLFRWDIFSDGYWETTFSLNDSFKFKFPVPGSFNVTMEVLDSQGSKSSVSSKIEVLDTQNPYYFIIDPRDQHYYSTVKIGENWIMAQNLQFGTYISNRTTPLNNGICEYFGYDDNQNNADEFGGLYLWDEALAYSDKEKGGGVCPPGWHIPSDAEWTEVEIALGMDPADNDIADYTRAYRVGPLLRMNSTSGFEAGFYGWRFHERTFYGLNMETRFWSSTMESKTSMVFMRSISSGSTGIIRGAIPNNSALYVRCFKNQ